MGFFRKATAKLFGRSKPATAKLFKSATQLAKEKEDREKEEMGHFLEISQQRGRNIVQEHRGKFYQNVKPMGRGEAPDMESFMYGEPYSRFASSNVAVIQFDVTANQLYVQFLNGRWYRYSQVSKQEAQAMWATASKGVWVWDHLRGRGSATSSKKPFTRDAVPPSYLPLDRRFPLASYGSADVIRRWHVQE